MNKKMGMILGGVGVVVVILLIFLLSGSSTKDMITDGKWKTPDADVVEFHDNGTISEYRIKDGKLKERKRENPDRWSLSDDEKILTIEGRRPTISFNITSISDDSFCVSGREVFCMSKYTE